MDEACTHLDTVRAVTPSSDGCEDCLRTGDRWHAHGDHPVIRSYEPGEDWWWCYADDLIFEVDGAPPSPSHP